LREQPERVSMARRDEAGAEASLLQKTSVSTIGMVGTVRRRFWPAGATMPDCFLD